MVSYQGLVDNLFDAFGAPVTLSDARDRLIAYSAQPEHLTDAVRRSTVLQRMGNTHSTVVNEFAHGQTSIIRFSPPPGSELLERLIVPLLVHGRPVGYLYFIDVDHHVDEAGLARYTEDFAAAALQLEIELLTKPRVHEAVGILVHGHNAERQVAASHIIGQFGDRFGGPIRVMAARIERDTDIVSEWVRVLGFHYPWGTTTEAVLFLLPDDPDTLAVVSRRRESLRGDSRAAIGHGVSGLTDVPQAATSAIRALRLAADPSVRPGVDPLRWDDVGAWRVLLSVDPDEAPFAIDSRIRRLITSEPADVVRMARAYLEGATGYDIAAQFHMHRTTLYSRLRKLQTQYLLDWDDPEDRLASILGLRLSLLLDGP